MHIFSPAVVPHACFIGRLAAVFAWGGGPVRANCGFGESAEPRFPALSLQIRPFPVGANCRFGESAGTKVSGIIIIVIIMGGARQNCTLSFR